MPSIKLSQQTYDEFERLKAIMSQMLNKEDVEDDQVISSLVGGFLESLNQEVGNYTHIPQNKESCCGGSCRTDTQNKKESCCGGLCGHKH